MAKFTSLSSSHTVSGGWASGIVVGNIRSGTFNWDQQRISATTKSSAGFKETLPGVQSGSGQIVVLLDDATAPIIAGEAELTILFFDGTTDVQAVGTAVLSNIAFSGMEFGDAADVPTATCNFEFTGEFTVSKTT